MAYVYILHSNKLNKYYTGSCLDLEQRIVEHKSKSIQDSFTAKVDDWILFFCIEGLDYKQARAIETHIKAMKSKVYIENLKKYSEMVEKLIDRFRY